MDLDLAMDRGRRLVAAGLIALAAFLGGVVLMKAGAIGGPVLMIAAPLCLLAAAGILTRPLVGVILVYLSFPVAFQALPLGALDIKVVEAVAAFVVGLVVLRRLATGSTPLPWEPQMWWALLVVGMVLAATPSALSLSDASKQDGFVIVGFLFCLAVLAAVRSMEDVRTAIGWLLAVGTGLCAYALPGASHLSSSFGGAVGQGRVQGTFNQPNDLGAFSAMILLIAVGMAVGARSGWSRLGSALAALVSLAALGLSLSRGGWIGTALGLLLLTIGVPQIRRVAFSIMLPALLVTAVVLAALLPSAPPQVEIVAERFQTLTNADLGPYDARPAIWREAIREIREDPWTGLGPGSFPTASTRSQSLAVSVNASHAHDVLLTVGAEAGLIAVFLLIGFTIALGRAGFRTVRGLRDPKDQAVVAAIGAGMACQIGQGLVDYNLRNPLIFILLWSLAGILLAAGRIVREEQERREEPRRLPVRP
jgi:O-antigen ligase